MSNIPILSPSWVLECWHSQSLLPFRNFLLQPFVGCIISVTGLSASTRTEIQRLVKAYGGEYTPNLTKRCTHLISQQPQGIKYRYALEWGIHCVSVHWLFDSINNQVCGDETQYFLPMSEATRQALFNPLATTTRDFNRLSPALREKHLMQLHRHSGYTSYLDITSDFPHEGDMDVKSEDDEEEDHEVQKFDMSKNFSDDLMDVDDGDLLLDATQDVESNTPDAETVAQIQKLLDTCDNVIEYYRDLSKSVDLSSLVKFLGQ